MSSIMSGLTYLMLKKNDFIISYRRQLPSEEEIYFGWLFIIQIFWSNDKIVQGEQNLVDSFSLFTLCFRDSQLPTLVFSLFFYFPYVATA